MCDVNVPSRREAISPVVMGFRMKSQATLVVSVMSFRSLKVGPEDVLESRLPEAVFRPSPFQPKSDFCGFKQPKRVAVRRRHAAAQRQ